MDIREQILRGTRIIAVVGLSPNPSRDSHAVAKYLQEQGYRIVPVNPNADEILGEKSYYDLMSIPFDVDMVNVFRRSEEAGAVARDAFKIGAKSLWLQRGVISGEASVLAGQTGIDFVMDDCAECVHKELLREGRLSPQ